MTIQRMIIIAVFLGLVLIVGGLWGCSGKEEDDNNIEADDDDDATVCDENNPDWTVGLLSCTPDATDGYTLISPIASHTTYLIDIHGRQVHSWKNINFPGDSAPYLLEDGSLLRSVNTAIGSNFDTGGGIAGGIERFSWEGELIWEFEYNSNKYCSHHDIEMLPNGNILIIAWQLKDSAEAIAAGRDPNMLIDDNLWPDSIIEVEPKGLKGGKIVWEWHLWDHLIQDYDPSKNNYGVVENHPELVNINFGGVAADWTHINAVDYNEKLDQIVISVHNFSEIWVIDHSTTIAEAAGHTGGNSGMGGDILYRWGNPVAYGVGNEGDQKLFGQHDAQWIPADYPGEGNFLIFNNGVGPMENFYSTVDEWIPPVDSQGMYEYVSEQAFGPESTAWTYIADNPTDFYSGNISGAQRLPTGNTLICSGNEGHIFEVTEGGKIVWSYINPVTDFGVLNQGDPVMPEGSPPTNMVYRSFRHSPGYPAFDGRDLTPGDYIEGPAD